MQTIEALKPDSVIVATGAVPIDKLPIEGLENTVQAWDVLRGDVTIGENQKVAIIGGGIVACEVGQMMLEKNNQVSVIEMLPQIGGALEDIHLTDLLIEFQEKNVAVYVNATAKKVEKDKVVFEKDGKEEAVSADVIILSVGQKSAGTELVKELRAAGYKTIVAGDAKKPAKFVNATLDGFYAWMFKRNP